MSKLTIIPEDFAVIDGAERRLTRLDARAFGRVPRGVHALQWDDESMRGEIEFEPNGAFHPENEKITDLPEWAQALRELANA